MAVIDVEGREVIQSPMVGVLDVSPAEKLISTECQDFYAGSQAFWIKHSDLLPDSLHTGMVNVLQCVHDEAGSPVSVNTRQPGQPVTTLAYEKTAETYTWELTEANADGRLVRQITSNKDRVTAYAYAINASGQIYEHGRLDANDTHSTLNVVRQLLDSELMARQVKERRRKLAVASEELALFSVMEVLRLGKKKYQEGVKQREKRVAKAAFDPTQQFDLNYRNCTIMALANFSG